MGDVSTSIIENEAKISENNATIAENQMKVYEAGVRAGLAQDPDYAEGYQDGLDSAAGVEWESLLDGRTPVGRAIEADHANEASHSAEADHSKTASFSTEANHAATSDNATNANRSTEATHSEAADHATEATHASEADHSAESSHAANADYATNAGHATTATSAMNASRAATADTATEASHAATAMLADEATYARNAPLWNVDGFVGKISPSIDMERLRVTHSGFNTANGTEESVSGQTSIPMINSGKLYLDFKTKTACVREEREARYAVTEKVDIYVNEALVQTLEKTHNQDDFPLVSLDTETIDTEYRHLLNVSAGDVVTIRYTLTLRRLGGKNYDAARAYLTVADIQLKANIITAHTYHTLEVEA